MEKRVKNWSDYERLFKEERYNVARIEDTYIYKLQERIEYLERSNDRREEEIMELRAELIDNNYHDHFSIN